MELQQHEDVKSTTRYWGYRELTAAELVHVSGGDDHDNGDTGGDTSGSNYDGGSYGDSGSDQMYAGFWSDIGHYFGQHWGHTHYDFTTPTATIGIRG